MKTMQSFVWRVRAMRDNGFVVSEIFVTNQAIFFRAPTTIAHKLFFKHHPACGYIGQGFFAGHAVGFILDH